MVIRSTLIQFNEGDIQFPDLPLSVTDRVRFAFDKKKTGNDLNLRMAITWWAVDNASEQLFLITEAATEYLVETDGTISIEELYCLCNNAAGLLSNHYNRLGAAGNIPLKSISLLPLGRFKWELLPLADWFAHGASED